MSLTSGTRVGAYEILALIGSGGMGEVYRAVDPRLKRQVALKVLPTAFVSDPDRIARFQREAEVLAALNHPNIAQIYGLEEAAGVTALVLELVEGPTLADRIAQGPLAVDEALPIARQIAVALEAAHEQGIVHRDLKPANIKVTLDGRVKVLDFGIAKFSVESMEPTDLAGAPTVTVDGTRQGLLLGTAAYMSPEQARGDAVDKRTDIWAFGCVFYEMLAGERVFNAEDLSDTLALVLKGEPDWTRLPRDLPSPIRVLIERCLVKDRHHRIADISTADFVLAELRTSALEGEPQAARIAEPSRALWRLILPVAASALLIASSLTVFVWWSRPSSTPGIVTRFSFRLPDDQQLGNVLRQITISPDGTRFVYVANNRL